MTTLADMEKKRETLMENELNIPYVYYDQKPPPIPLDLKNFTRGVSTKTRIIQGVILTCALSVDLLGVIYCGCMFAPCTLIACRVCENMKK